MVTCYLDARRENTQSLLVVRLMDVMFKQWWKGIYKLQNCLYLLDSQSSSITDKFAHRSLKSNGLILLICIRSFKPSKHPFLNTDPKFRLLRDVIQFKLSPLKRFKLRSPIKETYKILLLIVKDQNCFFSDIRSNEMYQSLKSRVF